MGDPTLAPAAPSDAKLRETLPITAEAGRRPMTCDDYIDPAGGLRVAHGHGSCHDDPAPASLFVHPTWLEAYDIGELVIVKGRTSACGVPDLVFERKGRGLIHLGRLLRVEAGLVIALGDALMRLPGVAWAVFEDLAISGDPRGPRRHVFGYQNNWRLPLQDAVRPTLSKNLLTNTERKLRGLRRERPNVALSFEPAPGRDILDRIAAFGRLRIESQGHRYGIDEAELARLAKVASRIGHASCLRDGDDLLAAGLIAIAGQEAYFLTHGYDPAYPRSSLGIISLVDAIETCRARGLTHFNLLWGDQVYKQRIGATPERLLTVVVRRPGPTWFDPDYLGAVLRFAHRDLKRRLKPLIRRVRTIAASRSGDGAPPA